MRKLLADTSISNNPKIIEELKKAGWKSTTAYRQEKGTRCYQFGVLYRFENNKFKKLAEVSLSGESCAVRGLYIDNYFYIVTLGKDVKVLDLNNYKVVKN